MRATEFIVITGPSRSGKTTVARALASRLRGKSAVIPLGELLSHWIVVHDRDLEAEETIAYRQARLLAAGYLKNRYHTIVEGPFAVCDGDEVRDYVSELNALRALMATIPGVRSTVVLLVATPAEIRARQADAEPLPERTFEALMRHYDVIRRSGALAVETSGISADVAAERVLLELGLFGD